MKDDNSKTNQTSLHLEQDLSNEFGRKVHNAYVNVSNVSTNVVVFSQYMNIFIGYTIILKYKFQGSKMNLALMQCRYNVVSTPM